jgi:hypothetical protein
VIEYILVFPQYDNKANSLERCHKLIDASLLTLFGGYSSNDIKGVWKDTDGITYRDRSIRYTVAATKGNEDKFTGLIRALFLQSDQKAIYFGAASNIKILTLDDVGVTPDEIF